MREKETEREKEREREEVEYDARSRVDTISNDNLMSGDPWRFEGRLAHSLDP